MNYQETFNVDGCVDDFWDVAYSIDSGVEDHDYMDEMSSEEFLQCVDPSYLDD